jgi:alkylation response protein AidB-like acyl-CoA dehydrogenase
MNFDFTQDQQMLRDVAQNFLTDHAPLQLCRAALDDHGAQARQTLWPKLAELGWTGITIPEEQGGIGLGYLELVVVAEQLGRSLAPLPFAASVYLATEALMLSGNAAQKAAYLPRLATGKIVGCFAFAEKGALRANALNVTTMYGNGRLSGLKPYVIGALAANFAIVVASQDGKPGLALVDLDEAGVTRTASENVDPSLAGAALRFEDVAAQWLEADASSIDMVLVRAAVPLAFEQLGGAERALELTRDYVRERYAFGRPIGSFQALKHRLADAYVDIELARANCLYAAWALSNNAPDLVQAASAARISASKAYDVISRDIIQMHGGVGFSWDYDCHLFYRRATALAASIGSVPDWQDRLMRALDTRNS